MSELIEMRLNLPIEVNILLKKFAEDSQLKTKEKTITYILRNFLIEMYPNQREIIEKINKLKENRK